MGFRTIYHFGLILFGSALLVACAQDDVEWIEVPLSDNTFYQGERELTDQQRFSRQWIETVRQLAEELEAALEHFGTKVAH